MTSQLNRIVVIGDSLVMPRPADDVPYEQTYVHRLVKQFADTEVICRAARANDSNKQAGQQAMHDDIEVYAPDIVIVQLGIVDCAPRLFSKKQAFALRLLPKFLSRGIVALASKYRLFFTKYFKQVYVPKAQFERNIDALFKSLNEASQQIICLSIASTNQRNKERSYGIDDNIKAYNDVLLSLCKRYDIDYVDVYSAASESDFILSDGIHINSDAHAFIANQIGSLIKAKFSEA